MYGLSLRARLHAIIFDTAEFSIVSHTFNTHFFDTTIRIQFGRTLTKVHEILIQ